MPWPRWNEAELRRILSGQADGWMPAALRGFLSTVGLPYGIAVRLRNVAYDRGWLPIHQVEVPVVSVGNLTVGGTGKTPIVGWLVGRLQERGLRVALLSRGYRSLDDGNDEAKLLARWFPQVPHHQGRDRVALASRVIAEDRAEVLVLDDGFQHRRLGRDLDLVLVDALDPTGGGRMLPGGLLREPLIGLRRASAILITRADQVSPDGLARIHSLVREQAAESVPIAEVAFHPTHLSPMGATLDSDRERIPLESLRGRRVFAFAGIGNPEAFWRTLERLGAELIHTAAFPDHFDYPAEARESLRKQVARHRPDRVVTTAKDAVKWTQATIADAPLQALEIQPIFSSGEEAVLQLLHSRIGPRL